MCRPAAISRYLLALWCLLLLTGCSVGPFTGDNSPPASTRDAEVAAHKLTAISTVTAVEPWVGGPPAEHTQVVYGQDAQGREMVVWVREPKQVQGHVYLDTGVSRQAAREKVQAAGYTIYPAEGQPTLLRNPQTARPYWWVQVDEKGQYHPVYVDFETGKVTTTIPSA